MDEESERKQQKRGGEREVSERSALSRSFDARFLLSSTTKKKKKKLQQLSLSLLSPLFPSLFEGAPSRSLPPHRSPSPSSGSPLSPLDPRKARRESTKQKPPSRERDREKKNKIKMNGRRKAVAAGLWRLGRLPDGHARLLGRLCVGRGQRRRDQRVEVRTRETKGEREKERENSSPDEISLPNHCPLFHACFATLLLMLCFLSMRQRFPCDLGRRWGQRQESEKR